VVQRVVGLSLAFHPTTGEPTVGLLGGAAGFVVGESIFWFQSDAVLRHRSGGVWTDQVVATTGAQVSCGNPVSDRGLLVGLWSSLLYDSTGKLYYAWRDGHDGQFPKQDWSGSDAELAEVTGGSATLRAVKCGGNDKGGWGGHLQLAMGAANQPALVHDQMLNTSDSEGQNVVFQRRNEDGSWTNPAVVLSVGNTQSGPSLAYDAVEGYGVAVLERSLDTLSYLRSPNGTAWLSPDAVIGAGTSGWYPSLAMDPINHEPAIAYYFCSPRAGQTAEACLAAEDELRVTQRIEGNWREVVVDEAGAYAPKLGFFASGKRFVAYREPRSGLVKLAVER
jgi:hypothetical protein